MMNKQQIDYAAVATKLSAVLGRKWGVSIVFGGHPSTNGTVITLPHWDLTNPKLRTALYGLIAHEAGGHVRQTDFNLLASKMGSMRRSPLASEWKSIGNILEDIRIEANLLRSYPGAAAYLNAAVDVMLCDPDEDRLPPDAITNYWDLVLNWCLFIFRNECLGQAAISYSADLYEAALLEVLPAKVLTSARNIGHLVAKLGPSKTEYAIVHTYSDRLLALFDENKPSKQQTGSDCSQGQQDGQSGSDGSQGQQGGQSGFFGSQGQKTPALLSEDGASQEIGDIFGELASKGATKDANVQSLPHVGSLDTDPSTPMTRDLVLLHARKAKSMTQSLVAALSPMLCGDAEFSANLKVGNMISQRRITRALTDQEPAIFRKMLIEEDQSVAVQILVDRSMSTQGPVLDAEIVSAVGIGTALEQFQNVESSISYFPAEQSGNKISNAPFIKRFGQPVTASFAKWPSAGGGTPLSDAYASAWFNFLHTEKQRKILIVLTDGRPDNADKAAQEKAMLSKLGVEIYGVIISNHPYPGGIFDDSEQISSPAALPRSLSALVRRNI